MLLVVFFPFFTPMGNTLYSGNWCGSLAALHLKLIELVVFIYIYNNIYTCVCVCVYDNLPNGCKDLVENWQI